jgi:hypothetical protein
MRIHAIPMLVAPVAVLAFAVSPAVKHGRGDARAAATRQPAGLTTYGRVVWNLDALLHDTFGGRTVCLGLKSDDFTTSCSSFAVSGYYLYTFATARDSRFRLVRRKRALVLGNVRPLKVRGAYVSCGGGRWLALEHGSANLPLACV